MARSEIGGLIDGVLRIGLTRLMKEHGWKKRARTFHRATEESVQVLNVQASHWNAGDTGTFTINLGVYFPAVADLLKEVRGHEDGSARHFVVDTLPAASNCHVSQRIGFLMPIKLDHWWEVKPGADLGDMGVDVAENVARRALPWFEERLTPAAASRRAGEGTTSYGIVPVALAIAAGELETARERAAQLRSWVDPILYDELARLHDRYLAER